jgi:predicted RNA-binding protein with PUA-like domain
MAFWLMKSEPSVYGIDDLERDGRTTWDGVRNYQVRNLMRDEMRAGDQAFFYHSSCAEPGVVGVMELAGAARPDPTQFDPGSDYFDPKSTRDEPRWLTVEVRFRQRLPRVIGLDELRKPRPLADLPVLRRGNRLSVTPVTPVQWRAILALL